eukprot:g8489.t1
MAGGLPMVVRCPPDVSGGSRIMVLVPRQRRQQQSRNAQVYMATVPPGVSPGGEFNVMVNSHPVRVACPPNVTPGMQIRIRLEEPQGALHQTFEVAVPQGVRPGQPFALIAGGQRVMVHCPHDARPGQKIRFQLPIQLSEAQLQTYNIHYSGKDGWVRCVGTDLKFHWVRHDEDASEPAAVAAVGVDGEGGAAGAAAKLDQEKEQLRRASVSDKVMLKRKSTLAGSSFRIEGSAFVRKLSKLKPRHFMLELVRAEEATLDASVPEANLTFQHLSRASQLPFKEKVDWFNKQCDLLRVPWDVEHQHLKIRRSNLLEDSMAAMESVRSESMRQRFRFEFLGEPGVDAGGVAREWFHLVSEGLFNPDFALFQYSSINQMCMQISANSGVANDQHLQHFHFVGRLLGKALFDGQLVQAHLVRPLYKHLLGWPIAFSDLEHVDHFTHESLIKMTELDDVEVCCLDFTLTEDRLGSMETVDLKEGGSELDVTNENIGEYVELVLKHRLLMRMRDQLTAFLVGFYDVIPEALLSVFDFQELELLMCGLPVIDLQDWQRHTDYTGEFERKGGNHKIVKWFWEVMAGFETEQLARVLQFVTGTSGVPSQGFAVLQGNDGNIRRFTINGLPDLDSGLFPKSHTCFNRIDLPMYSNKKELEEYLTMAINMECTGFGVCEEEDAHLTNSEFLPLGRATAFIGHPPTGVEASSSLVSTRWGEDSDEGSVREEPVQSRFGAATDHEDSQRGAVFRRLASSSCGSNDSGDQNNGIPVPVPAARWGEESDDDHDHDDDDDDDDYSLRRNLESGRHVASSRPSGTPIPAVGDIDEHAAQEVRFQDEQEPLQGSRSPSLPQPQLQQGSQAATSWGSDDGDDAFDFQPQGLSQPLRMGAVAGPPASIVARSAIPPTTYAAHASASWGNDGENGDDSGSDNPFSPTIATLADADAHWLSPGRHRHHHNRRGGSDEVVVSPWMHYAQRRSGLANEPDHSWADESGDDDDTGPRRTDNLNRILMGGAHAPSARKKVKEVGPPSAVKDGEKADGGSSGVRAWGWRDTLRNAPGLAGRLTVCVLAVCALWLTSLNVVVDVTGGVIPSPTLTEVITAVAHAYFIVQEEREASKDCLASSWTESCRASVREVEVSVKTWLTQGTGHSLLYSTTTTATTTSSSNSTSTNPSNSSGDGTTSDGNSNCSSTDRALVADFLGDVAPSRDSLASAATEFVAHSVDTVVALSSYARERSEYDAAYVANATTEVAVDVLVLLDNVTFEVPGSVSESLAGISDLGGTLVSCVSLRGDDNPGAAGQACPIDAARELADEARAELDYQLEIARAGFQEYADAYEEYRLYAEQAFDNWMSFYDGVTAFLSLNGIATLGVGEWSLLNAADFVIERPVLPSSTGVLSGFGEALTSAEIWDSVSEAYGNFSAGLAAASNQITADVDALEEAWRSAASDALSNISVRIVPQDYEPPLYGNASTDNGSSTLLGSAGPGFRAGAHGYHSSSLALLEGLGPAAANLSFPVSPSLNSTLLVGNASTVLSSPIDYTFAAFTGTTVSFDSWVVSLGNLALLLLLADYVFRTTSSLRLFVRFWGRGGLGMPDADVRVDKAAASAGGVASGFRGGLIRVVVHPVTTVVFFGVVLSLALYNLASLYVPLFEDYRAGCVEKTQSGSFFGQNLYSIAYNYAADHGNRDKWNYQEDHTSRRGALCVELTANVRQYLAETDAQLRVMYEAHYDDVTAAAIVAACIDTAGMDALYAEACCGYDGYTNDTCAATGANSTLQCPLNYASGVAEAFGPLNVPLSDEACSPETLDVARWKVEDGIELDCDTIPACRMTCAGPNEELLRVVTVHAGCMMEWMFHAGAARMAATLLMFVFLNVSRVVLVGGFVKLNWRHLHPGVFTFKGTCTRAGELIVKNPEQKADKSRESVAAAKAATAAGAALEIARGGGKSPLARARARLATRATRKKNALSRRGRKSTEDGSGGEGVRGDTRPKAPTTQPPTFKRIISGAVEEGLGIYENGARLQILLGVVLNIPWLLVLWFGRGSNTAYVAD